MKKTKTPSGLTAIIVMILAMQVSLSGPFFEPPLVLPDPLPPPPPVDELIPSGERLDRSRMILLLHGENIEELSMEQYLIGVVAAEMPAAFELEALKAQAVAARTNALHSIQVMQKPRHPDAFVCSDFSCCTAYNSDERLRVRWGADYVDNIEKIIAAVVGTDGVYMTYNDEPILASFHSSSAGSTESSENVWVTALPYLRSVYSPETDLFVPNYVTSVTVSTDMFIETLLEAFPEAVLDGDENSWITDITHTESGRVLELKIGGIPVKGTVLRSMFNLRSTAVTFEWSASSGITFTTTGFGHGVGMSQYGANVMAIYGQNYMEILSVYYKGVNITSLGEAR